MLIKIIKQCRGSAKGVIIDDYEPSEELVEVDDDLARVFVEQMKTAEYPRGIKAEDIENTGGLQDVEIIPAPQLANMEWASNADLKELRVFADKHGIKDRSVEGMRDELLEANLLTEDGGYKGE